MKLSPSLLLSLASLVPRRAAAVDADPFLAAVRAERAAARADHYQSFATQENEKCFAPGCELRTGTYEDPYGDELAWWAFVPTDCPTGGCPLFVAIDGTGDEFFDPNDQQNWMIEMVGRGFVGVTMAYANSPNDFGFCFGQPTLSLVEGAVGVNLPGAAEFGVVQKAQSIFDATREGSIVQQVCDGPDAFANCDLGIAVAGLSQGALMAAQGSNFEKRISALLLWAVGDIAQNLRDSLPFTEEDSVGDHWIDWDMPCMDSVQLPAVRRRMINGDADNYFGRNIAGTLQQFKRMIGGHYDCGDGRDCLTRPAANVSDAYTGATIADEGGYFFVEGDHAGWLRGAPAPYFADPGIEGGPASFDWLARTARLAYGGAVATPADVEVEVDLSHWRNVLTSYTEYGLFVEWADANGAFGQRQRIGEDTYTGLKEYSTIPEETPGIRLSAVTNDGAFVDQVQVFTTETTKKSLRSLFFGLGRAAAADDDASSRLRVSGSKVVPGALREDWGGDDGCSFHQKECDDGSCVLKLVGSCPEDEPTIFRGMKFGENNDKGWCVSTESNDTFGDRCEGGQAHLCVDFCVGGDVHVCTGHDISKCVVEGGLPLGALEESS